MRLCILCELSAKRGKSTSDGSNSLILGQGHMLYIGIKFWINYLNLSPIFC